MMQIGIFALYAKLVERTTFAQAQMVTRRVSQKRKAFFPFRDNL